MPEIFALVKLEAIHITTFWVLLMIYLILSLTLPVTNTVLVIVTTLTVVAMQGYKLIDGDEGFYTTQISGSSAIVAILCAVTVMQPNQVTGTLCVAAFTYYLFASVGHFMVTKSVSQVTDVY